MDVVIEMFTNVGALFFLTASSLVEKQTLTEQLSGVRVFV